MRSEKAAIKRLTGIQPKVSSHFFINLCCSSSSFGFRTDPARSTNTHTGNANCLNFNLRLGPFVLHFFYSSFHDLPV